MKAFLNVFVIPYFFKILNDFKKQVPYHQILVLDIDNTIADTWPEIKYQGVIKSPRFSFFKKLRPFKKRIAFLINRYPTTPIVFLSNRNVVYYNTTRNWLIQNGFSNRNFRLILTLNVEDKLRYLKLLQNHYKKVIYFDDLSYNHEHGEVKYYQIVIDALAEMELEYWGLDQIQRIK